jgi:hypothetical protein
MWAKKQNKEITEFLGGRFFNTKNVARDFMFHGDENLDCGLFGLWPHVVVVVVFNHEIRPMWLVSVSIWTPSKRRLRGLPGRLLPRGWYSINAFGNLELFMRWTRFTQLRPYFVIFTRTDVVSSSCEMSSFFLWSNRVYPAVLLRTCSLVCDY